MGSAPRGGRLRGGTDLQQKKTIVFLAVVLAASCAVLGILLYGTLAEREYLPQSVVENVVSVLAESNIEIDPSLVSTRRRTAAVYVFGSADYDNTVAALLADSPVKDVYVTPDGAIFITESGARVEFGADFSFRYRADGGVVRPIPSPDLSKQPARLSEEGAASVSKLATEFIERGSRTFESGGSVNAITTVESIWTRDGAYYALCVRSINGAEVNANRVVCAVRDGVVTEAWGNWVFLTPAESYSAQLYDLVNILFHMKKEIGQAQEPVSVEEISLCYSLYFYGEKEDFCLIPCYQIVTSTMGNFIFNALDGTVYTRK